MSKAQPISVAKQTKPRDEAHFSVSEDEINMQLLDRDMSETRRRGIDFSQYMKLILFGFQYNLKNLMHQLDPSFMKIVDELLKMAPGYSSTQQIFTYYLITSNIANAFAMALLYPLPYAIIFTYLGFYLEQADANQTWDYSPLILIILTGVRSSLIALLAKYAMVKPQGRFYWVVLLSTFVICTLFRSNYVYMVLYVVSIFLSFYVKEDARQSSINNQSSNITEEQKLLQYRQVKGLPETYPGACIIALLVFLVAIWVYERYTQSWAFLVMLQFIFIGLLNNTKVMLIFFPILYQAIYSIPHLKAFDLVGINFIIPGSNIKPFFSFIGNDFTIFTFMLVYLCLYLPSILLVCVFLGHRKHFYSPIWNESLKAMQAVSNGMILSMILYVLIDEDCNFGSVLYAAICIFCVVHLYNLRQITGAFLGIFLIFSRAGVLYMNKGQPFHHFACLPQ